MYRNDRLSAILAYLKDTPVLDVETAMELFDASQATIRRDFSHLVAQGAVTRGPNEVRSLAREGLGVDQPMAVREVSMRPEKDAIGKRAAELLHDGDVVFIDGGTTTHAMVRHIAQMKLNIITTCIRIANTLNERRQDNALLEVVMPGGVLMARSYVLYGPHTRSYIESYSARIAFIGVDGTDGDNLFSVNEFISSTQSAMIACSQRTVLLADHTKFGRPSMVRTAPLDEKITLITDKHPSSEAMLEKARRRGVEVIVV